jgi:SAM-dependent methyltransferase
MAKVPVTPARITWAVSQLPLCPDRRILEIGPGRGAAAALVCDHLAGVKGSYVGIDRSATAVQASIDRNHGHVQTGKAHFEQLDFEQIDPAAIGTFDIIFAINVNLFWTRPAQDELALIRKLLDDQGQLWLFYEAPSAAVTSRIATLLVARLDQAGYAREAVTEKVQGSQLLRFRCSPG